MKAPEKKGQRWNAPDKEWLEYHYMNLGKSPKQLAEELGCCANTVRKWLKKACLPPRYPGWGIKTPSRNWLEHQYWGLEKSLRQIALEVGVSAPTVTRWVKDAGISLRTHAESLWLRDFSGEGNPNWRGGRWDYLHHQARKVIIRAGIPRRCAVCEEVSGFLGFLVVHHIDGDERNNTLKNLQYLCNGCHRRAHLKLKKGGELCGCSP